MPGMSLTRASNVPKARGTSNCSVAEGEDVPPCLQCGAGLIAGSDGNLTLPNQRLTFLPHRRDVPGACLKLVLDCLELEAAFAAISARAQFNSPNCRSAHCNGQTPYKNYESTERTQLISHCIPQSQQPCIASVEQVNPVDHCNLFSFSIVHLQAV